MEYYSTIIKREMLPFVTTWINLEGIIPSEINQRKTNILWSDLHVKFLKRSQAHQNGVDWWLPGPAVWGKWDVGQGV